MKIIALALAAFLAFVGAAHAVPLVGEAAQTCAAGMFFANPEKSAAATQNYNTCPSMELTDQHGSYMAVRLEPGFSAAPIDRYGMCFYLDNHSTEAVFAPASTPQEWAAFLDNSSSAIEKVRCCRPITIKSADTCEDTVTIDYARNNTSYGTPVGTQGRELTYQCQNGEWVQTATNNRPCNAGDATASANDSFDRTGQVVATQAGWATQRNFQN